PRQRAVRGSPLSEICRPCSTRANRSHQRIAKPTRWSTNQNLLSGLSAGRAGSRTIPPRGGVRVSYPPTAAGRLADRMSALEEQRRSIERQLWALHCRTTFDGIWPKPEQPVWSARRQQDGVSRRLRR